MHKRVTKPQGRAGFQQESETSWRTLHRHHLPPALSSPYFHSPFSPCLLVQVQREAWSLHYPNVERDARRGKEAAPPISDIHSKTLGFQQVCDCGPNTKLKIKKKTLWFKFMKSEPECLRETWIASSTAVLEAEMFLSYLWPGNLFSPSNSCEEVTSLIRLCFNEQRIRYVFRASISMVFCGFMGHTIIIAI